MKAIFERKPSDFDLRSFEVSKTIRLSAEVFEDVLKNPMRDYDFIQDNIEQMHCDSGGVYHCLLLTGEGRNDGLLVESEGYGYCRYASYVPKISALTSPAFAAIQSETDGGRGLHCVHRNPKHNRGQLDYRF